MSNFTKFVLDVISVTYKLDYFDLGNFAHSVTTYLCDSLSDAKPPLTGPICASQGRKSPGRERGRPVIRGKVGMWWMCWWLGVTDEGISIGELEVVCHIKENLNLTTLVLGGVGLHCRGI